jgi:hypothetical protein
MRCYSLQMSENLVLRGTTWGGGVLKKRCGFLVMEKIRKEILAKIKQAVKKIEPKVNIILFGYRARGDERTDSDGDLLILIPGISDSCYLRRIKLFY